jgi:hypothetical protein
MQRYLVAVAVAAMTLQTTSCGLVLHPERQGQTGGKIDPGVAILDAAGLIVFIIPGLIAFGVDFLTGCIYLPGGSQASNDETAPLRRVYVAPSGLSSQTIEETVATYAGQVVDLADASVVAVPVADEAALRARLAQAL